MRLSPFNPIAFRQTAHECAAIAYAPSDHLLTEVFHSASEEIPALSLYGEDGAKIADLAWNTIDYGDGKVSYYDLCGLGEGIYCMTFGELTSDAFCIGDTEGTVRIHYTVGNNNSRSDILTLIKGGVRWCDWRVKGGFKDSGVTFGVDNEQYVTQDGDRVELHAVDFTDRILTIGDAEGVTRSDAEMINRILSCPLVYVDGTRYTRSGDSLPETACTSPDGERAVYTVLLREGHAENAIVENAISISLRRAEDDYRKALTKLRIVP